MAKKDDKSSFSSNQIEQLVSDGKNNFPVVCVRCPSRILNASVAEYKETEFALPLMTSRKDRSDDSVEKETLKQYWMVNDKFSFENIGFSNTVSGHKYLTCADCEIGPIGWFDPQSQSSYVSISRVKYQSLT